MRYLAPLAIALLVASTAFAQPETVETDPIRCWWRTSAGAVRIGEQFTLVLTCAVLEADSVQVVPDESRLSHSVVQLAPFEVVTGEHPPDIRSGQRRFFQYEYVVRALGADMIAQDVPLPNLSIHYRVNSRLPGNAALEGRDLTYLLPAHVVRVVSTVPSDATDIRDTPDITFDRIESLRFRAGVLDIVAMALVALGSLMAIVALVGMARRARPAAPAGERLLGERTVLAAAARELSAVQAESEAAGWTDTLIDRALAATRLAAAAATGRRIGQAPAKAGAHTGEGRLIVRRLGRRGAAVAVSSPVTAEDLARDLTRTPAAASHPGREQLDRLRSALATLAAAQYSRAKTRDRAALTGAVEAAADAAHALKAQRLWPREQLRRLMTRHPEPGRA